MSARKAGRASYLSARKARRGHLADQIAAVNTGGARCSCGWTTAQRGLRTPADALRAHLLEAKLAGRAPGAEQVVHEVVAGSGAQAVHAQDKRASEERAPKGGT